jgi:hypothetical protein
MNFDTLMLAVVLGFIGIGLSVNFAVAIAFLRNWLS